MLTGISIITSATTLTVTNTDDTGPGSLRAQIAAASSGDTILFDASLNNSTIYFYSGDIDINTSITILGPGRSLLSLDGVGASRVFNIKGADVTIKGLTLAYCKQIASIDNSGGAIFHQDSGDLTLSDIYFYNNQAVNNNGSQGGALAYHAQNGHVSLDSCIFSACYSDNYGGAISLNNSSSSGTIKNCIFDDNTVQGGKGVIFINLDTVEIINTSITRNYGRGTILDLTSCESVTMLNTTISNNTDINDYGIVDFPYGPATVKVINCTIKDNTNPVRIYADDDPVTFISQNTIYDNAGDNFQLYPNTDLTLISNGGNVSNDTTGRSFLNSINDTNDVNPMLGPLEGNVGIGQIHPLNCGSVAFNNGVATGAPLLDQRGMPRYRAIDAGAYEQQPLLGTDVQIACRSFKWINGVTYMASNSVVKDTIASSAGCDSIVTLNLTINNVSSVTTTVTDSLTITADNSNGTYQWLDCNNGMSPITDSTNQSINPQGSGNYAVEITENGCLDTSDCVNFIRSSIIENSFSSTLTAYPNPTNGNFTIEFDGVQAELNVQLLSVSGQVLEAETYTNTNLVTLEITQPKGVYLLKVTDNNGNVAVLRLIKY